MGFCLPLACWTVQWIAWRRGSVPSASAPDGGPSPSLSPRLARWPARTSSSPPPPLLGPPAKAAALTEAGRPERKRVRPAGSAAILLTILPVSTRFPPVPVSAGSVQARSPSPPPVPARSPSVQAQCWLGHGRCRLGHCWCQLGLRRSRPDAGSIPAGHDAGSMPARSPPVPARLSQAPALCRPGNRRCRLGSRRCRLGAGSVSPCRLVAGLVPSARFPPVQARFSPV